MKFAEKVEREPSTAPLVENPGRTVVNGRGADDVRPSLKSRSLLIRGTDGCGMKWNLHSSHSTKAQPNSASKALR